VFRYVSALWGICGVIAIVGFAVIRLFPIALDAFTNYPLHPGQWLLAFIWCFFMIYAEGWKGFHKGFSPRVVARARTLITHPDLISSLLAPFFCFGLFRATTKRKIVAWSVLSGVICLVLLVRLLPQPWRGLIDLGVVAGLTIGILSIVYHTCLWLSGKTTESIADLPLSSALTDK